MEHRRSQYSCPLGHHDHLDKVGVDSNTLAIIDQIVGANVTNSQTTNIWRLIYRTLFLRGFMPEPCKSSSVTTPNNY